MTDRGRAALRQSPERFTVGPSSLHWTGDRPTTDLLPNLKRIQWSGIIGRYVTGFLMRMNRGYGVSGVLVLNKGIL